MQIFLVVGMINDQSMFTRAQAQAQTFTSSTFEHSSDKTPLSCFLDQTLFISSTNDDISVCNVDTYDIIMH